MDRSIFGFQMACSSAPAFINTANLTSTAVSTTGASPTKKPANIIANTPALRAAQKELKSKAILSLELAQSEAAAAETVQQKKTLLETLEAAKRRWLHYMSLIGWQPEMRFAFGVIHRRWEQWNPAGGCFSAWNTTIRRLNQWDEMVEEVEQARKDYEKAREELAVLRLRTEYAVSCVEALRAYLVEVRKRQQLGA